MATKHLWHGHRASRHRHRPLYVVKMQMDGNRELNCLKLGRPSVSTLPTEVVLRLHRVSECQCGNFQVIPCSAIVVFQETLSRPGLLGMLELPLLEMLFDLIMSLARLIKNLLVLS